MFLLTSVRDSRENKNREQGSEMKLNPHSPKTTLSEQIGICHGFGCLFFGAETKTRGFLMILQQEHYYDYHPFLERLLYIHFHSLLSLVISFKANG